MEEVIGYAIDAVICEYPIIGLILILLGILFIIAEIFIPVKTMKSFNYRKSMKSGYILPFILIALNSIRERFGKADPVTDTESLQIDAALDILARAGYEIVLQKDGKQSHYKIASKQS